MRTYKNAGVASTSVSCRGIFGCEGARVEIECNHVFYIQNDKLIDYIRTGSCTEEEDLTYGPKKS